MSGDFIEKNLAVGNGATANRRQRRSERVALHIPLKMSARLPDGRRICLAVKTQVVNAHGGLLEAGMEFEPGQKIMLNNNRSPQLITATILRVEPCKDGRCFATFEFEFPTTDFWPPSSPFNDLEFDEESVKDEK
jgi:hypothetical protein